MVPKMAKDSPRVPRKVKQAQKYQSILLSPDSAKKEKLRALRGLARLKNVIVKPDEEEERKENLTITALRNFISLEQPKELYEKALKTMLKLAPADDAEKEALVKIYQNILEIPLEGPTYSLKSQKLALAGLARLRNVVSTQNDENENLALTALRNTISSKQPQNIYESALKIMLKLKAEGSTDKSAQVDFYESLLISKGFEFDEEMGRLYTTGKPAYSLKARKLALDGLAKLGDVPASIGLWDNATIKALVDFISPEEPNVICEATLKAILKLNPLSDSDRENLIEFYHDDILTNPDYSLKTRKLAIEGLEKLGEAERLESISNNQELEAPLRETAKKAHTSLTKEAASQDIASLTPKRIPKKGRRLTA